MPDRRASPRRSLRRGALLCLLLIALAAIALDPAPGRAQTVSGLDPFARDSGKDFTGLDAVGVANPGGAIHSISGSDPFSAAPIATLTSTRSSISPSFPATESGERSVAEHTATGIDIGDPFQATDPDTGDSVSYSLAGSDAAHFAIDASSGQLRTNGPLDYEAKSEYSLTVVATDSFGLSAELEVTIEVTNIDEEGSLSFLAPSTPRVGTVVTTELTDPDGGLHLHGTHRVQWDWSRSPDGSNWSAITYFGPSRIGGGLGDLPAGSMYTPLESDVGMYLRVIVTYTDGHGAGKRVEVVMSSVVQAREAAPALTVQDFITGLTLPRDIGFTPDGAMLFTERGGKLSVRLGDGTVQPVTADFSDLQDATLGVLMSLAIDPDFATNRRFYMYQGDLLLNMQVVVWEMNADYTAATRVIDPLVEGFSGGARLRFGPDGYLWMSVHYSANHAAPQDLGVLGGKVLRFDKATGRGAADNPFPAAPLVYTYGHRNAQGLALRPGTTQMWSVEHGPLWDDEVNLLTPGANHGWNPNLEGAPEQAQYASMTDLDAFPDAVVARWTSGFATIAPSGATFLEGDDWGEWEGRLAVATLKTLSLRLFEFSAEGEFVSQVVATDVERLHYRLRTPVLGPDGALYITTSDATNDPGRIEFSGWYPACRRGSILRRKRTSCLRAPVPGPSSPRSRRSTRRVGRSATS